MLARLCPRVTPCTALLPSTSGCSVVGRYVPPARRAVSPTGRGGWTAGAGRGEAHGKHLLLRFDDDQVLHVHLGIYGTYALGPMPAPAPTGAVRLRLAADTGYADVRGPNACELLEPGEAKALRDRLGPDPLRADADPGLAWRRIERSRSPLAVLLLDQTVVAGPGNIYRAEVLFRARDRSTPAGTGPDPRAVGVHLGRPVHVDGGRRSVGPDRHRAPRAHPGGDGPSTARRPRRRGLRLPSDGSALPGVCRRGDDRAAGRPQPVLVPELPAARLSSARFGPNSRSGPTRRDRLALLHINIDVDIDRCHGYRDAGPTDDDRRRPTGPPTTPAVAGDHRSPAVVTTPAGGTGATAVGRKHGVTAAASRKVSRWPQPSRQIRPSKTVDLDPSTSG